MMVTSDIGAIIFCLLTFKLADIIGDNKDIIVIADSGFNTKETRSNVANGHGEMVMRAGGTLTSSEFKGEN